MARVDLSHVGNAIVGRDPVGTPKVGRADPAGSLGHRFSTAMDHAIAASKPPAPAATPPVHVAQLQPPVQVAQLQPPVRDAGVGPVTDAAAEERARRVLQLDAPQSVDSKQTGDTILEGLQKLRGVFDAQEARINSVMSEPNADFQTLMALQMEVVKFSLLVDVTSKLTGKSTQAFDTLMKGQ
jgi:type III secretion system YscI/HrpB-like protein